VPKLAIISINLLMDSSILKHGLGSYDFNL